VRSTSSGRAVHPARRSRWRAASTFHWEAGSGCHASWGFSERAMRGRRAERRWVSSNFQGASAAFAYRCGRLDARNTFGQGGKRFPRDGSAMRPNAASDERNPVGQENTGNVGEVHDGRVHCRAIGRGTIGSTEDPLAQHGRRSAGGPLSRRNARPRWIRVGRALTVVPQGRFFSRPTPVRKLNTGLVRRVARRELGCAAPKTGASPCGRRRKEKRDRQCDGARWIWGVHVT
jgi:hypothetical protein